jgi:uncharacterized protein with ParB-like and HNH nuclease domain
MGSHAIVRSENGKLGVHQDFYSVFVRPEMKVDKLTVVRVFDRTERLEAPLFQRPYVWNEERNWVPLWESIKEVADHKIDGRVVRPHFLGAVVMDQLHTIMAKVPARQIIDGQQRLTTLQLSLAAARDLADELQQHKYALAFRKLTDNDVPLSDDPDEVFKVWPTNADRVIFTQIMRAGSPGRVQTLLKELDEGDDLIPKAYMFFANSFREWVGPVNDQMCLQRLDALYNTLRDQLHLVVIDLEKDDDAQEIFETLNALGTPLQAADLVKNYLFRMAELQLQPTTKLYEQYWATFDSNKSYWRKEVRQGRLNRPRLDLFLHNFLTLMLADDVNAMKLFSTFRDYVSNGNSDAARQMASFRHYADVYRAMDELEPSSREGMFIYRLDQLDTTTFFPLLLEVFKRFRNTEQRPEFEIILLDLESFLVRRTVCELTTKNYNELVVRIIKHLRSKNDFSSSAIRAFLQEQTADTSRWPLDDEFRSAWMNIRFYKSLKRSKVRMILEALELATYSGKTEKVQVERRLTIEHLMPVSWEKHWPIIVESNVGAGFDNLADNRNEFIHRIGNLTLLTKELNPSVSNGPWLKKRDEILKHSALNLNRPFQTIQTWNEECVERRSAALFDVAKKIWPRPV